MFEFSSVLGGPGGRRMERTQMKGEPRKIRRAVSSFMIRLYLLWLYFTHRCDCSQWNENFFVLTDSRSKGEAVTPIVTRAWVIASGPSSAARGRFFHNGCPSHKKRKKR